MMATKTIKVRAIRLLLSKSSNSCFSGQHGCETTELLLYCKSNLKQKKNKSTPKTKYERNFSFLLLL